MRMVQSITGTGRWVLSTSLSKKKGTFSAIEEKSNAAKRRDNYRKGHEAKPSVDRVEKNAWPLDACDSADKAVDLATEAAKTEKATELSIIIAETAARNVNNRRVMAYVQVLESKSIGKGLWIGIISFAFLHLI